jgi:hypothetical protein
MSQILIQGCFTIACYDLNKSQVIDLNGIKEVRIVKLMKLERYCIGRHNKQQFKVGMDNM